MLSVILLILKIIGIAILALLGIILFLLLVVLFVPIRYRVKVEHGDSFALEGGVSWLLHLIHARISQSGGNRRIWVRIMGILIYDSLRPPKVNKMKDVHTKAGNTKKDDIPKSEAESEDIIKSKEERTTFKEDDEEKAYSKGLARDNTLVEEMVYDDIKNDSIKNDNIKNDEHDDIKFFGKIKEGYRKIKSKIISLFEGIKSKIKEFMQKFFNIKDKASLILNFINDDINKKGFRFTYETLIKVLKHILPKKIRSRLIFGTGDPCSTGQCLGVFGILYGLYGDNLQITPDFENKVFKGSHYVKGRIRIWTLLIIFIKLLLDKRFKDLKMNYQLLKEAL